jgi:thymidine kinase
MAKLKKDGRIEIITGPMFAGKTEELLRRIRRLQYAKKNIVVFKPTIDDRYSMNEVVSHDKNRTKSVNISRAEEMFEHVDSNIEVVAIDEIQFLNEEVCEIIESFAAQGIHVIVSGLDTDFRGEPFGFIPKILSKAESVVKLSAICVQCGAPGTKTQRMVDGKPARYHDPIVLIGASESYEARCRHCHRVYAKPKLRSKKS